MTRSGFERATVSAESLVKPATTLDAAATSRTRTLRGAFSGERQLCGGIFHTENTMTPLERTLALFWRERGIPMDVPNREALNYFLRKGETPEEIVRKAGATSEAWRNRKES